VTKNKKIPRYQQLADKAVRQQVNPDSWRDETITFRFSSFDFDGPWGQGGLVGCDWREIFRVLENIQTMKWGEILLAAGSVRSGTNHHPVDVGRICKAARDRLIALQQDPTGLFSFHIRGKLRVYGIRDRRFCTILWLDPWHDDDSGVCPSHLKHT
jgi:hypothetical protein